MKLLERREEEENRNLLHIKYEEKNINFENV